MDGSWHLGEFDTPSYLLLPSMEEKRKKKKRKKEKQMKRTKARMLRSVTSTSTNKISTFLRLSIQALRNE